jgi:DNA polymerase
MPNLWFDLETRSPVPIKDGVHRYAEQAEILLWAYAIDEGEPVVWDITSGDPAPDDLVAALRDPEMLVWGQNAGMFDFVVLHHAAPWFEKLVPMIRWRDTMVQAYAHSLPGSLEKLGAIFDMDAADQKLVDEGRKYIRLFCIPHTIDADGTPHYHDKQSHPVEWAGFIRYAARDIKTMRVAHHKAPMWNYRGKQVELWHENLRMNYRGFAVDVELAEAAIAAAEAEKARLAKRTKAVTMGWVDSATQRDELLRYICAAYGVELPDMQADTLERRMDDPDLPAEVKELLGLRLRASMNSPTKYKTGLKGMSRDGRLRGCEQFRGALRTGRSGHRLFQPGNLPRPAYKWAHLQELVAAVKAGCLEWVSDHVMQACASMIRCMLIAGPGKKLVVADLSNIEGRMAAWLAGEDWKLQAFRAYDAGEGHDLYVISYCRSFGVSLDGVPFKDGKEFIGFDNRQIGKVEELMFQYGGGVGAWITGAATYGIDLDAMHAAVRDTLPEWAIDEARDFLHWLDECAVAERDEALKKWAAKNGSATTAEFHDKVAELDAAVIKKQAKQRFGLKDEVWVTCDAIKRLWRRAHPAIVSYWRELEDTIKEAIENPGQPYKARKVVIQRDGTWLRIKLPSGRYLCYPNIRLKNGKITYVGPDTYSKKWGDVNTYGGKVFENIVQAASNDQFMEPLPTIVAAGYLPEIGLHDEWVTETPDTEDFTAKRLSAMMTMDLGWNAGLPLAADGWEDQAFHKAD